MQGEADPAAVITIDCGGNAPKNGYSILDSSANSLVLRIAIDASALQKEFSCEVRYTAKPQNAQAYSCARQLNFMPCDLGCTASDTTADHYVLDGTAGEQAKLIERIVKRLRVAGQVKSAGQKELERAQELYLVNWEITWNVPTTIVNCANEIRCSEVSLQSFKDEYSSNAAELRAVTISLLKKLNKAQKTADGKRRVKGLQRQSDKLFVKAVASLKGLPEMTSSCR